MANLLISGNIDDFEYTCDSCEMTFTMYWNRNPIYDRIEYCPFCGAEIEEIIFQHEGYDE